MYPRYTNTNANSATERRTPCTTWYGSVRASRNSQRPWHRHRSSGRPCWPARTPRTSLDCDPGHSCGGRPWNPGLGTPTTLVDLLKTIAEDHHPRSLTHLGQINVYTLLREMLPFLGRTNSSVILRCMSYAVSCGNFKQYRKALTTFMVNALAHVISFIYMFFHLGLKWKISRLVALLAQSRLFQKWWADGLFVKTVWMSLAWAFLKCMLWPYTWRC